MFEILTAACMVFIRLSFLEVNATLKLRNVLSSAIITGIFMWHLLVDCRPGRILGAVAFVGGLLCARLAIKFGDEWLRGNFLTAVWLLGMKGSLLWPARI